LLYIYKNTLKKSEQKKKCFFGFYLRTSTTTNGNFRGLPGAVDNVSIDDDAVIVGLSPKTNRKLNI
jgi:hypothetical protein